MSYDPDDKLVWMSSLQDVTFIASPSFSTSLGSDVSDLACSATRGNCAGTLIGARVHVACNCMRNSMESTVMYVKQVGEKRYVLNGMGKDGWGLRPPQSP